MAKENAKAVSKEQELNKFFPNGNAPQIAAGSRTCGNFHFVQCTDRRKNDFQYEFSTFTGVRNNDCIYGRIFHYDNGRP